MDSSAELMVRYSAQLAMALAAGRPVEPDNVVSLDAARTARADAQWRERVADIDAQLARVQASIDRARAERGDDGDAA
jgi:hypothetical protein